MLPVPELLGEDVTLRELEGDGVPVEDAVMDMLGVPLVLGERLSVTDGVPEDVRVSDADSVIDAVFVKLDVEVVLADCVCVVVPVDEGV